MKTNGPVVRKSQSIRLALTLAFASCLNPMMLLDLSQNRPAFDFYQQMGRHFESYPNNAWEISNTVPTNQRTWYGDDDLYHAVTETLERWVSTYSTHEFQTNLRATLRSILKGASDQRLIDGDMGYEESVLFRVYASRSDRWSNLAEEIGLSAIPTGFAIWRGTDRIDDTVRVVRAWIQNEDSFGVSGDLASWSLLAGNPPLSSLASKDGARAYFNVSNGVLFSGFVDMENTLFDVLVDNSIFARRGWAEAEIVVSSTISPPVADLARTIVKIENVEYSRHESASAQQALKKLGFLADS